MLTKDDAIILLTTLFMALGIITFWLWIWKEVIFT